MVNEGSEGETVTEGDTKFNYLYEFTSLSWLRCSHVPIMLSVENAASLLASSVSLFVFECVAPPPRKINSIKRHQKKKTRSGQSVRLWTLLALYGCRIITFSPGSQHLRIAFHELLVSFMTMLMEIHTDHEMGVGVKMSSTAEVPS